MAEKRFKGSPFGAQSARFDVSGVQPARKTHTYTEMLYGKKRTSELERKLGPGTYNADSGDFSARAVQERAKGPGWKRAQEMAQFSKTPPVLFCAAWEKEQLVKTKLGPGSYKVYDFTEVMQKKPQSVRGVCATGEERFKGYVQKTKLGPGSYKICDFTELMQKKPRSMRGVCATREERFKGYVQNDTPGPGTYGKGGIPDALKEEKRKQSAGTCPTMDFSYGVERYPYVEIGSGISPCMYSLRSSTDMLLNRKAGVWKSALSERRNKPFDSLKEQTPDPGQYTKNIIVFGEDFKRPEKKMHGLFGKLDQYPCTPRERIYHSTLSQCPRPAASPGPGHYNVTPLPGTENRKPPPFLTSARRFTKRSQAVMNRNFNTVGPGRYYFAVPDNKILNSH
ncbi:lymphocyte expansion molecule-like, partial [Scleropages formosus]|uniref:lymphocyte expansion molecule-like n=1 Tax=Scleropages formosus TaxID=113540 RepID=UPI0010FA65EE